MSLNPAEKAAALAFRTAQRGALGQKNASEPPDITVSVFIRQYRHDCARQGGKSVNLELREHYIWSPGYLVIGAEAVETDSRNSYVPALAAEISACRFGWIYTEGRCPACGIIARSRTGRLVDPETRAPAARAVARG